MLEGIPPWAQASDLSPVSRPTSRAIIVSRLMNGVLRAVEKGNLADIVRFVGAKPVLRA